MPPCRAVYEDALERINVSYHLRSYRQHSDHLAGHLTDPTLRTMSEAWLRDDTADWWRHWRMYRAVDCFLQEADATWLTVGDGRYGLDAIKLRRKGVRNVLPTDISGELLKAAKEGGLIDAYAIENAESLSFPDGSFDYVLCKESFHHFPRPMVALYEMLRVARGAVVLVEPNDSPRTLKKSRLAGLCWMPWTAERRLKEALKALVRRAPKTHITRQTAQSGISPIRADYERAGNYVYLLSKRELTKVALGLNLPGVAFKGFNDFYVEGCEFASAGWRSPHYRRIRLMILQRDILSRFHCRGHDYLMAIIFKNPATRAQLSFLRKNGWEVLELPRNPYA